MDHFRLRKYRGPEIWAKVREAYVAGESAPQVAARFDVGLANLRKKASREGWTRTAAARTRDPLILATQPDVLGVPHDPDPHPAGPAEPCAPPEPVPTHPAVARDSAISRAAALLAAGRAVEATALLKAAETLSRLTAEAGPPPEPELTPEEAQKAAMEAERAREEHTRWVFDQFAAEYRDVALKTANAMLCQTANLFCGDDWSLAVWHWRARVLGPEIALSDFAYALNGGWADCFWDGVGTLRPLDREIPEPDPYMVRQHLRRYPDAALKDWPWNTFVDEEVETILSEHVPGARVV